MSCPLLPFKATVRDPNSRAPISQVGILTVGPWICSDDTFLRVFRHTVCSAAAAFEPDVVVLQCGADALVGDPLGEFNLTQRGRALLRRPCLCCVSALLDRVGLLSEYLLRLRGMSRANSACSAGYASPPARRRRLHSKQCGTSMDRQVFQFYDSRRRQAPFRAFWFRAFW